MVIFGPLILLMSLAGKKGIVGLLQKLDHGRPQSLQDDAIATGRVEQRIQKEVA